MSDLFAAAGLDADAPRPLADRLRPCVLGDVVGQDHLIGPNGPIGRMLARKRLSSMILWGPPGVGKTTIARLLAAEAGLAFATVSAVFSGVADLRKAFETARALRATGQGTLLFVDEIHRFNRAQQDGFLPFVEEGVVTLVGATTENPSFEINGALLSRAQVFVLKALDGHAMDTLLARAEVYAGRPLPLDADARGRLIALADGDGRHLLTLAETVLELVEPDTVLDAQGLANLVQRRAPAYDKDREGHYNLISALHKSIRASDPDAALYWLARMVDGGENLLFIARRLVRAASEDIGLADPAALMVCIAARDAVDFLGAPEGELALAHATLHLATAPKSNAAYVAWKAAQKAAREEPGHAPPARFLNAPTALMKAQGYGAGYRYDHDAPDGFAGQSGFPDAMARQSFYEPTDRGREASIAARMADWAARRRS